jgi:hypothetical protein
LTSINEVRFWQIALQKSAVIRFCHAMDSLNVLDGCLFLDHLDRGDRGYQMQIMKYHVALYSGRREETLVVAFSLLACLREIGDHVGFGDPNGATDSMRGQIAAIDHPPNAFRRKSESLGGGVDRQQPWQRR